jgi:hypothetical protein
MSDVKEVKVAMTESEEKAISRLQTRRKRLRKKLGGGEEEVSENFTAVRTPMLTVPNGGATTVPSGPSVATAPSGPSVATAPSGPSVATAPSGPSVATAPSGPSVATAPSGGAASVPAEPTPVASPTAVITAPKPIPVSGGGPVRIQTRKRTHAQQQQQQPHHQQRHNTTLSGGTKILPVKRHAVPSKTKPVLMIPMNGGSGGENRMPTLPPTLAPSYSPPVQAVPFITATAMDPFTPVSSDTQVDITGVINPELLKLSGGARKTIKRRKFEARKVRISMKNVKTTHKNRKSLRKKVAAMNVVEIRKILLKKGILRPKSNPPESMIRSMMYDFLTIGKID